MRSRPSCPIVNVHYVLPRCPESCRRNHRPGRVLTARLHAARDLRVHDEQPTRPSAEAGWSRIAVTSVGLCGSDLHWFLEGGIGENTIGEPVVPGHEVARGALDGP